MAYRSRAFPTRQPTSLSSPRASNRWARESQWTANRALPSSGAQSAICSTDPHFARPPLAWAGSSGPLLEPPAPPTSSSRLLAIRIADLRKIAICLFEQQLGREHVARHSHAEHRHVECIA